MRSPQAPRRSMSRTIASHLPDASSWRRASATGSDSSMSGYSPPSIAASQISRVSTRCRITWASDSSGPSQSSGMLPGTRTFS